MRKIALPVWTAVGASLIIVALVLLAYVGRRPSYRGATIPGQAAGITSEVYLRGGLLQQNLGGATPDTYLEENTMESIPGYENRDLTVHVGSVVSITLHNDSTAGQQHGWVLVSPGALEKAERESREAGAQWGWIPNSTDVLAFVPLTQPGQSRTVVFRAPPETGNYPFFCPFPGHGNAMNGVLHVVQ